VTKAEWDRHWLEAFNAGNRARPGLELSRARVIAFASTTAKYGARPEYPPKTEEAPRPSLLVRIAVSLARKRLVALARGLPALHVGGVMLKNVVLAVVYGVGASYLTLQLALQDSVISGAEWSAIAGAFVAAFWGKFSQPDRPVSTTPTEPK
jgi:hypothetical protein